MSKGDVASVATTLMMTAVAAWLSGPKLAVICFAAGLVLFIGVHFWPSAEDQKSKEASSSVHAVGPVTISSIISPVISPVISPQQTNTQESRRQAEPISLKPNLRLRRTYEKSILVGHALGGHHAYVFVAEIGNEIGQGVGNADNLRAHLTYKNNEKTLQVVCPAHWEREGSKAYVKVGESKNVVLAFADHDHWISHEYDGISLGSCSTIELRFLDKNGVEVTDAPLIFDWPPTDFRQRPQ